MINSTSFLAFMALQYVLGVLSAPSLLLGRQAPDSLPGFVTKYGTGFLFAKHRVDVSLIKCSSHCLAAFSRSILSERHWRTA